MKLALGTKSHKESSCGFTLSVYLVFGDGAFISLVESAGWQWQDRVLCSPCSERICIKTQIVVLFPRNLL